MTSLLLAVAGALLGAGGLLCGLVALLRTGAAVEDRRAAGHRSTPGTDGTDPRALRDVAMVRYDALEEGAGARSFSLAVLDASGDGIVLTSINGRTEARTYAKPVRGGVVVEAVTPEESRAVRAARLGNRAAGADAAGPRRVRPHCPGE